MRSAPTPDSVRLPDASGVSLPRARAFLPTAAAARVAERLTRPVPALPVDLLRVLVGLLALVWFLQILRESGDFANPNGLIDHELVQELFWYTRISLFQPGISLAVLQLVFAAACVGCVLLVAGVRPRLTAVFLYLVAVSTYRWNFPVIYVDDSIMHLVLFWMILLPTGRTLTVRGLVARRRSALEAWSGEWVPGLAVRCFLANAALVYLVADAWKWTSPKWREGSALQTALEMPISRAPDFWGPESAQVLALATWLTLVLEPLLPLMFVLPTGHPVKWALLVMAVGFHLGIATTMKIPYANLALIAVGAVAFREEIAAALARGLPRPGPPSTLRRVGPAGLAAASFVVLLALAMAGEGAVSSWRSAPRIEPGQSDAREGFLRTGHNPLYAPLWMIGIAQSYRLFDWVDDRNWDIRYEVVVVEPDGRRDSVNPDALFPMTTHNLLLQSYMHGVTWGRVAAPRADELKESLVTRYADRYCRNARPTGRVEVWSSIRRITEPGVGRQGAVRELFLLFECEADEARLVYVRR
jgi:hypothetical protein